MARENRSGKRVLWLVCLHVNFGCLLYQDHLSGFMATFRRSCANPPHCRLSPAPEPAEPGSFLITFGLFADAIIAAKAFLGGRKLDTSSLGAVGGRVSCSPTQVPNTSLRCIRQAQPAANTAEKFLG
jgi:hypothetical protein